MELFVTLCVVLQILGLPVNEAQQLPAQVSSLHAAAVSPTSVHVTWLPGNRGKKADSRVLGYRLEYTDQASAMPLLQLSSLYRGLVLTSLKPDTEYTISVSAYNRYGIGGKSYVRVRTLKDPSADERSLQVPPPVSRLNAVPTTSTSVTVTWSPGNGSIPVEGYKVGYGAGISDVFQVTLAADARSVELENLEPDTEYAISIRAYNEVGYSRTTYAVVSTPDNQSVPPPVSRLNAVPTTSTSVTVTWSPGNGSIPVEGYKVGYGAGISDVFQVTLAADARSVDLKNLEPDTEYAISIRAYNEVGYSRTTYAIASTPGNQSGRVSDVNAIYVIVHTVSAGRLESPATL